jgi:hypothetical protein
MNIAIRTAVLFTALALQGCASGDQRTDTIQPAHMAKIQQACRDVMGFNPGEVLHRDCLTSLGQSIASVEGASAQPSLQTSRERDACARIGLTPGTAVFHTCVGNLNATVTAYNSGADR